MVNPGQYMDLVEYAARVGKTKAAVLKAAQRGSIPAIKIKSPNGDQWVIPIGGQDFGTLHKEWIKAQRTGFYKNVLMTDKSIQANVYGLDLLFTKAQVSRSIESLTLSTLDMSLKAFVIDDKAKNCHFTQRDLIFKAYRSFTKFLISKGIRQPSDLEETKAIKPKRKYQVRVTVLSLDDFNHLVESVRVDYMRPIWRQQTLTMLYLFGHAGLRRQELIDLTIDDVQNDHLIVTGKGGKCRLIPVTNELEQQILAWLRYRPVSRHRNLLLQENGQPFTEYVIRHKLARLCKRANLHVTPHGLRRTCATALEQRGLVLSELQDLLGHSDAKVTQGYLRPAFQATLRKMRGPQ